ncbi:uncharacterized protein EV154DRAFT_539128 [Mucor mucedo]|uniref:uncharacterized protein n=1 Tax=Mucor mucedo TaxID=29922 RepID=UPI00221F032F|nr:uncharacterized protein EV154DRAFT_539128 [Mucor mucedo]KAI7888841.1 hypothetical protein EV154DRAFT_539128 [Mucor mucedo]
MKAWEYLSGWTNFSLPNNIQKRLYKFLLRKAIGQFLQNELDLENFDIGLMNGSVELRDLDLNLQTLNKLLNDTPFILEEGKVACINATIPWTTLWSGDISLKIQGLHLALRPIKNKPKMDEIEGEQTQELHESIQKSFHTDLQDADMEGLQVLTKVIDKMLAKIKIDIVDTLIRIRHQSAVPLVPADSPLEREYHLDICIPRLSYYDETPEFNSPTTTTAEQHHMAESSILLPPTNNETIKFITLTSPEIWLHYSPSIYTLQTQSETTLGEEYDDEDDDELNQTEFFDTEADSIYGYQEMSGSITPKGYPSPPYKALLFTTMNKRTHLRMKLRPSLDDTSLLPIKQVDFLVTHMRATLTPLQVAFFIDLLDTMSLDGQPARPQNTANPTTDPLLDDLDAYTTYTPPTLLDLSHPERKIKIILSLIELYILADDDHVRDWKVPYKDRSHIKFAMEGTNVRIQQFPQGNATLDTKILNIVLDEWIKRPKEKPASSSGKTETQYEVYTPILQFDNRIKYYYRDDDLFPSYDPRQPIHEEQHGEVVRIKIERKQPHEKNGNERRPSVFDDFKTQGVQRKVRVRCAFIRILLFVPDMSQSSTREEFNDTFHASQLSIDVKKLVAHYSNSTTDAPPLGQQQHENKMRPTKIHLDLNYVNVFMQQGNTAETWFTAKTGQGKKLFSEGALCPTIEIIIMQNDSIHPTAGSARRSTYFGAGSDIPSNLFHFLNRNENFDGEQKLHIPMEDQSESAMIFKQSTMETSMFVINCHLPQTNMNLTKSIWDKVQLIQNDLLLWQPKFLLQQQQQHHMDDLSSSMHSSSIMIHQQPIKQKTLASIQAVMSNGVWDIHTSDIDHYRFQFSEFRYFAAIKHLGMNENMTTLDIEELSLTDISDPKQPIPLIYKTLPKTIHPKKESSMLSLFSKLTSYPDVNRIEKETSIVACNLCWKATPDIDFINHILDFQKVPQEMVFIDPPTQYIKIFAHILETSIDYDLAKSPSRVILILDGVQVITNVLAGQPFIDIKTCVQTVELCMMDDTKDLVKSERLIGKTCDARKYWSTLGFANLLTLLNIEVFVKLKLDEHAVGPTTEIELLSSDIGMDSSTDSFQSLLNLVTFCANHGDEDIRDDSSSPPPPATAAAAAAKKTPYRPHQTRPGSDLLASLDENAFRTSPTCSNISPPTLIEAPEMEEFSYVEEFYKSGGEQSSSILIQPSRPPTKPRRKQHRIRTAEDIIRVLVSPDLSEEVDPFQIVEDYFGIEKKVHEPKSAVDINQAVLSLRVSNVNFCWKLYDGYTWEYVRLEMASKQQQDGFGQEDKKTRDDAHMEIKLDSISLEFDLLPPLQPGTALYFHGSIKEIEIIDNIKTSNWKKFLGYMRPPTKDEPRELDACMLDIEFISLRPVLDDPQEEFRLKVKTLPLRLYVDHDALNFLVKYFTFDKSLLLSTVAANDAIARNNKVFSEKEETGMFFQYVDIHPMTLKVDYKPKYINYGNIKEGQYAELVNLFHLDGAEMSLSHVKLTGIKGMDGLLDRLGQEWLPHIKNTQVTNMVSGVSPIRSIVNLSNGVADLVLLPIRQYRKDGRLIKGLQRGTSSFARATAIEAIKLSSRVATGTQVILEHADGFFASPSTTGFTDEEERNSMAVDQHFVFTDIYGVDVPTEDTSVVEDTELGLTADTIFAVPVEDDPKKKNASSVIRAVPVAVLKPMIGLTGAFQSILTGLRNSIDPVMRLQSEDVSSLFFNCSSFC